MKRKRLAIAAVVGAIALSIGSIAPAAAGDPDDCTEGSACLYYNSNLGGAFVDDTGDNIDNYDPWKYSYRQSGTGGSNGIGQYVKNNAASISSGNDTGGYRVYFNSNYAGVYQTIGGNSWANLNSQLKNNNASGRHL
ncbi:MULTISPECIES: peptidase inhibitor family I36 protein [unclassified Streptomyces]|uniref:peptidase inhibitor family I36 protein n=1 Tax=unclassified Streptomyces TaxID=2593676 RepID=UPI0033FB6A04